MNAPVAKQKDRERRLEEAMAEYLIAADAGRPPELEAFLARHRDLRNELEEFFADLSAINDLAEPLLPVAALPGATPAPNIAATQAQCVATSTLGQGESESAGSAQQRSGTTTDSATSR